MCSIRRNDHSWLKVWVLLALNGAVWLGPPLQAAPPQVDIATIREAWQKRQDAVRSFRCVTTVQLFKTKEWKQAIAARPSPIPNELPPQQLKDIEYEYQNLVIVDGSRMRFESDAPVEVGRSSNSLFKRNQTRVFDGELLTTLSNVPNLHEGGEFLQADLYATNENNRQEPQLMPLLVTYRGNDLEHGSLYFLGFDLRKYTVTPEQGEIDGRPCVILRSGTHFLWLDPSRDFVVVRLILMNSDFKGISLQDDLFYREHPDAGWVPTEWQISSLMPDGRLQVGTTTQVRQIQINPRIPADTFSISIPPGTLVLDSRKGPPNTVVSVQLADDKRVEVPPGVGAKYSEILARAKAIDAADLRKQGRLEPMLIAAIVALFALAGGLIVFWRLRHARA